MRAALREGPPRALLDPGLRVLGPPELPGGQLREKLRRHRAAHGRAFAASVLAAQQLGHAACDHLVAVGEHGLPRHVRHLHDLRHAQLVLRDQAHHQQTPPRPIGLGLRPRRFDLRHQLLPQFW